MTSKKTKTYQAVQTCYKQVLDGTLLCIDPSTGSKSSQPGFALYKKGVLVESGEISVNNKLNRSQKLYEISRTIREELPEADVLAVEYIPPVTYRGSATSMNGISIMALQKAIGSVLAARPFPNVLEIPASAWRKYKPDDYKKTDEFDAITIGLCVVSISKRIREEK